MNDSRSCEFMPLDVMHMQGLWMIWIILRHEHKDVDDMNDFGLWAQGSKYIEQLRVVVDMSDSCKWT